MQLNATVLVSCFRTEGPGLEPTELTAAETAKAGQRCSAQAGTAGADSEGLEAEQFRVRLRHHGTLAEGNLS